MFWALALLSLSLAATPATKPPIAAKGKAPAKAATPSAAKSAASKAPAKAPAAKVTGKAAPAVQHAKTPYRAPGAGTRVQAQPQYSRYSNTSRRGPVSRTAVARQRPVYHPVQITPSQERTKEIQSALVQRGYLSGEPSGTWDAETATAMKRFQHEQNLDADGKISALSLIALGLGPKRTLSASSANPPLPGVTSTPSTTNPIPPKQ